MSDLIEHILTEDFVGASRLFEDRLDVIREQKLYEMKRHIQAEAMGGKTIAQAIADIRARGMTPRKAADALGDPRDRKLPPIDSEPVVSVSKKKKLVKKKIDEAGLGDAAKIVHSMSDQEKQHYKAAMKGDIGAALKFKKSLQSRQQSSQQQPSTRRPGMIKRNINTFMGREPGYVDTRTPEEKMMQKGGSGGKIARSLMKSFAANSPLEE